MAKRKHAAALFEVFHDTKPASRSASSSRGYGWWFKNRLSSAEPIEAPEVVDPNDPTTMTIRSPLLAPRIAAVEAMEPVAPAPKPAAPPKPLPVSKPANTEERELLAIVRERNTAPAATHVSLSRFHLDSETRDVTLRVPLNSALITAFGILVCLGAAYVIGRHVGKNEGVAAADASALLAEDARQPEPQPDVLDLPRHASHPQSSAAAITAKPPARTLTEDARYRDHENVPEANSVHGIVPVARPAVAPADGPRIIGLNYLLIQNYPNQASAAEAREFLAQNGIACTVEKVPAGFFCPDPAWMSVITSRGFDKEELHAAEYENFKHQIEKLGDKFAGTGKFKRFSIQVYKLK